MIGTMMAELYGAIVEETIREYREWLDSPKLVRRSGEPWDNSGYVVPDYDQTNSPVERLSEYLDAYTGQWEPTYFSGMGRNWLTHYDEKSKRVVEQVASVYDKIYGDSWRDDDDLYQDAIEWHSSLMQNLSGIVLMTEDQRELMDRYKAEVAEIEREMGGS